MRSFIQSLKEKGVSRSSAAAKATSAKSSDKKESGTAGAKSCAPPSASTAALATEEKSPPTTTGTTGLSDAPPEQQSPSGPVVADATTPIAGSSAVALTSQPPDPSSDEPSAVPSSLTSDSKAATDAPDSDPQLPLLPNSSLETAISQTDDQKAGMTDQIPETADSGSEVVNSVPDLTEEMNSSVKSLVPSSSDPQPVVKISDEEKVAADLSQESESAPASRAVRQGAIVEVEERGPGRQKSTTTTTYANDLERHGLQPSISRRLSLLFSSGKLSPRDLDDRAIDALKEYGNLDAVLSILNEFEGSNLEHVNNKSAFLCRLMKTYRQKEKAFKHQHSILTAHSGLSPLGKDHPDLGLNGFVTMPHAGESSDGKILPAIAPGPDDALLKAILQRTGYSLDVTSGQRKYGGPPPDWTDPPPGPGCEIFVGKIPKELFEEELIPVFEEVGKIWDLRLMIDPANGYNRGFAFITYCTKEEATSAQLRFDGYEIRKGKTLKVNVSVPNLRLFVGNIPKSKSKAEILTEFSKLTGGLNEVIVYSSPDDRKKNRGFCFLEFESHKAASLAKRKLTTGRTKVWGCDILVDWADPQEEPDQATMERVKVLYVRNLVADVTEDELKEVFSVHGQIERVKKIKDYAFIHFEDRDSAVDAMRNLQDSEVRGVRISVSLAKPPSDRKKKEEILRNRERRVHLMMQQRSLVPGMMIAGAVPPLPPSLSVHQNVAPVAQNLPNGGMQRIGKSARGQSYHIHAGVIPPAAPPAFRSVPQFRSSSQGYGYRHPHAFTVCEQAEAANGWLPSDWLPYTGLAANWNWAYGSPDPRSGMPATMAPGPPQYSRSAGLAPHHSASGLSLNANARNPRSLWTPNGPTSSSISGTVLPDSKHKNWRRHRNNDNNDSGPKSGDARL